MEQHRDNGKGPIILAAAGDYFEGGGRIALVLWVGSLATGNRAVLSMRNGGNRLWGATYPDGVGASFTPYGLAFADGFHAAVLDAGELYVYLLEK